MWNWSRLDGAKTVFVREPFSLLATYPQTVLVSLLALICLYLFHSADKLFGILGIFVGSLSIIIAIYSIESTTKKLDASIKQLSEIQIDYWNTRGIDQYKQKRYREADQSYERAISLNQNDAKIWTNIAVSLYEQKMLDEALYAINKAIELNQNRSDSWNNRGIILLAKAIKSIEKHIELNINLREVWTNKYVIPFAQNYCVLENHSEENDETTGAWNNNGEALLPQVLMALEKAIELETLKLNNRSSTHAGTWLNKGFLAGTWTNVGNIRKFQHKYGLAINAYDKAIEQDPKYVHAWFNKGFALMDDKRPNEAIAAFKKAIELDPRNVDSWYGKGHAFMKIARTYPKEYAKTAYDEAIHAFDRTIEFNPLYHDAWYWKGYALFERGDYSEAIEVCDKALEINPYDFRIWHNKCVSLNKLGKYDEAITTSYITIGLYKQYALSWFEEYNRLNKLGKYDDAIEAYDEGLDLYTTKNSINYTILGDAICNLSIWHPERFEDAIDAYNRAIKLDRFNMVAWCGRCIALSALGYIDPAREAYNHAYRLTLLYEKPYHYVEDSEKPFYWP